MNKPHSLQQVPSSPGDVWTGQHLQACALARVKLHLLHGY